MKPDLFGFGVTVLYYKQYSTVFVEILYRTCSYVRNVLFLSTYVLSSTTKYVLYNDP